MSHWSSCKRREFVRRLRVSGFDGPFSGTRHQFMAFGGHRLSIPSIEEFLVPQLRFMSQEVTDITGCQLVTHDWNAL
jgi:hypothetical protein